MNCELKQLKNASKQQRAFIERQSAWICQKNLLYKRVGKGLKISPTKTGGVSCFKICAQKYREIHKSPEILNLFLEEY